MPRPEQPEYRAPEGSDQGSGAQLQRAQHAAPMDGPPEALPPAQIGPRQQVQRHQPEPIQYAPPDSYGGPGLDALGGQDLNGGLDSIIFAPSERPGEPITAGAPFGEGPNFTRNPAESDRAFMLRVATTLASAPTANDRVRQYAAAIAKGR